MLVEQEVPFPAPQKLVVCAPNPGTRELAGRRDRSLQASSAAFKSSLGNMRPFLFL